MTEIKVRLSMKVPGAQMLSSQECEKNPKENFNDNTVVLTYSKEKGKSQKIIKKTIVFKTRKQRLVSHNINICKEAYQYMLSTPTTTKLAKPIKFNKNGEVVKRVWDTLSEANRLKHHFDLIAYDFRAVSYSYEVLDD